MYVLYHCCHKHAFQKERKSFVITPVYKGFWEVLVIISKKSSYSCLWSCKWGDSLLVSWGGGEPTLRRGGEQGPPTWGGAPVALPPAAWALSPGLRVSAPEPSPPSRTLTLGFFPLRPLSFEPCASLVPEHPWSRG